MELSLSVLTMMVFALITALGLLTIGIFSPVQHRRLGHAVAGTIIFALLVGFVIFPGLLFVEQTNRG